MNVLVTGGSGFVGSKLIPRLHQEGYTIRCLVRSKQKQGEMLQKYPYIETHLGDTTEEKSLIGIENGIDVVVHLAAVGHVSAMSEDAYKKFISVNEVGTQNLVNRFVKSTTLQKFIHFSSTAAMGPVGKKVINENDIPNPITPYQKSKLRSEKIIEEAYEKHNFPGIILRPCMIYGEGGYGEFYKFCKLMKKGVFPKVGLKKNLTPLVNVEDVVEGTIGAIRKGMPGECYLIASECSLEMDVLHRFIMQAIGSRAIYPYIPSFLALMGARAIEMFARIFRKEPIVTYRNIKSTVTDRVFDISKAKNELGYKQNVDFRQGIKKTIEWYKLQNAI